MYSVITLRIRGGSPPQLQREHGKDNILISPYRFPELNGLNIGFDLSREQIENTPILRYSTLNEALRTMRVNDNNIANNGGTVLGRPYGPFVTQAPLVFDANRLDFLEDCSTILPGEYVQMLDEYIYINFQRLTGLRLNGPVDNNLRRAFTIWLWILSKRARILEGNINNPYFEMKATIEEVNEVIREVETNLNQWNNIERAWINIMLSTGREKERIMVSHLNTEGSYDGDIIRRDYILPWKENQQ